MIPLCLADAVVATVVIILGFVVIIGLIVWFSWRSAKKRVEEFQRVADEIGLPFYPRGDNSLLSSLHGFHLFSVGYDKTIRNMLHGNSDNVEVAIFDYAYAVGSGDTASAHFQSVIYFRSSRLALPHFALRPESIFHKMGSAMGYQDIDFDSHPQFSRTFLLQGADEASIRSLFKPELLTFLESQQQISIEGGGDQMVYYRNAKRIKPEEVRDFMQQGFEIYSRFLEVT